MDIGKQILSLRKQRGITQEVLAAEMGVTVGAVSKWENGNALPDIIMICALADFFEVSTDELLGRTSKKRGFIVCDDARFICTMIKNIVEKEDYECIGLAENGTQLWELLGNKVPHFVFLDIHFPNEDGLEMLKQIKERYTDMKVLIVTADTSENAKQKAYEYGASGFIEKPFLPEHIAQALKDAEFRGRRNEKV